MNINDELTRKIAAAAHSVMVQEDNTNNKSDDGEGLDKVQPNAVKKKFDDRKDKDIDNDGDVDGSDEYIHAKRQAISKAIKSESTDIEEADMSKQDRLKGIAARRKELEATISRLRATHAKDTGEDRVATMRALDMNKELLKKVMDNEKKVKGLKESSEDLEEGVDLEKAKILTPDEYDEVQNFKNFNKKDWKWNAIQRKFIRIRK